MSTVVQVFFGKTSIFNNLYQFECFKLKRSVILPEFSQTSP